MVSEPGWHVKLKLPRIPLFFILSKQSHQNSIALPSSASTHQDFFVLHGWVIAVLNWQYPLKFTILSLRFWVPTTPFKILIQPSSTNLPKPWLNILSSLIDELNQDFNSSFIDRSLPPIINKLIVCNWWTHPLCPIFSSYLTNSFKKANCSNYVVRP